MVIVKLLHTLKKKKDYLDICFICGLGINIVVCVISKLADLVLSVNE